MDASCYERLCKIVYDQSGITIRDGKMSMVASRIAKRLRALGLESELDYVRHLEESTGDEIVHLLDAISTNVTSFYRESHHFDVVRQAMQAWLAAGQSRFRFWSAACSTGEEPYTLAMTTHDTLREQGRNADVRILATDISTRVLEEAQAGLYPQKRVESIPAPLRARHMRKERGQGDDLYRMGPELRQLITFRRMNLSQPPFPMKGPMDIIFCRNVMIYFDNPVRDALLEEFHRLLRPDGYLMVGHSEGLTRCGHLFRRDGSSTYRPIK